MAKKFSELVIEGRFMLVKGFLLGFLAERNPQGKYFFHRKAGIRRETFKEMLKEFFELDNYVHLCLEDDLVEPFKKAADFFTKITGNTIKSIKPVKKASFSFAYELFNKELAQQAKQILENLPQDVVLVNYVPFEEVDEEGKGTEAYAPLHEYVARAKGEVSGDFEGVMDVYLKIKRSEFSDFVMCSDVKLELG